MKKLFSQNSCKSQRGLSLVEILIVIVILVFGVLSIIKVFPSGFLVMRNTANVNRADRIESAMLGDLVVGGNVPGGVYSQNGYSTTQGPLFNPTNDPTDPNNLNAGSYINQEPFTVPSVTSSNPNPIVVLPFGPISYATGATGANGLTVVSTNWKEIQAQETSVAAGSANNTESQSLTDGQYAVDTTDPAGYQIVFPVEPYDQTFNVNYKVGGQVQPTITFTLPGGGTNYPGTVSTATPFNGAVYGGYWDTLSNLIKEYTGTAGPATWDYGSLQICRPLSVAGAGFGADPYEYRVDTNADVLGGSINLGVLEFSPHATAGTLGRPLKVLVSYSVYNWGILHNDDDITSPSDVLSLSVGGIREPGVVQNDQSVFSGLFPTSATVNGAMVALDLDTGQAMTVSTSGINFTKGQVLSSAFPAGHSRVRMFYETNDDLALALQKAPIQFVAAPASPPATNDEALLINTSTTTPNYYVIDHSWNDSNGDQILFPAAYAGQTIQLENLVWTDFSHNQYTLGNVTVNISSNTELVGSNYLAYADITQILVNAAQQESKITGSTINIASGGNSDAFTVTGIGGVSARAVCIWHESGKWKIHNVDTIIN